MKILVTGAAGFIGFHVCKKLLALGHDVTGLDNINNYYDTGLKLARLEALGISNPEWGQTVTSNSFPAVFRFIKVNLEDRELLAEIYAKGHFDAVCNLAAQAGVRYSIENPFAYVDSNVSGFVNVLECCRHYNVPKLVYASSSSVYGTNEKIPFSTDDTVDHPISLYAATKKANELMAHTYSHLFGFKTIGLRFFTVYGPWGRPDMAMFLFTEAIIDGKPIKVFNNGNLSRDFTYIDDIVEGVYATLTENSKDDSNYQLYNIGNSKPVRLLDFIEEIERNIGKPAIKEMLPMQPGDVEKTWADVTSLQENFGYSPKTTIQEGVAAFVVWYKAFYKK